MDEPASKARLADVHVVTKEDIAKSTYTIEDVVLPLPGSQIKYPAHSTAEVHPRRANWSVICNGKSRYLGFVPSYYF